MIANILIVDDETDDLQFLAQTLESHYRVILKESGKAALEFLESENVQLVISDIVMGEIDGFALCRRIKTNVNFSHIPVILLSSTKTVASKIAGFESGADAYLEKPFSPRVLLAQVASLINNREYVRRHFAQSPLVQIDTIASSKTDEEFVSELTIAIRVHMDNPELDVDMLAAMMNTSRATLYRKIKAISDVSPLEFITIVRLKQAALLLKEKDLRVYEVALMTGFNSRSSFTRNFTRQFNQTPSDFLQAFREKNSETQ